MKSNLLTLGALALLSTIHCPLSASPLGTAFTYQGKLSSGPGAVTGFYDFNFAAWDAPTLGAPLGGTNLLNAVPVTNGLFTVTLDFGSNLFAGEARWLEIAVRTNGNPAGYRTLPSRQQLMPAPQALWAQNAGTAAQATQVNTGAVSATSLNTPGTPVPGQVLTYNGSQLAWMSLSSTGAAWSLTGNSGTAAGANFLGTTDNQPLELKVNGQRALRLEPSTNGAPNVIGGYAGNQVSAGVYGATIAGGGSAAAAHLVGGSGGTVGGGAENQALGMVATIGGGEANVAGGSGATVGGGTGNSIATNASFGTIPGGFLNVLETNAGVSSIGGGSQNRVTNALATIGGGNQNLAGGLSATVAGGEFNKATGWYSAIAGGSGNQANGQYGFVGGGDRNKADGNVSFAAGRRAQANHDGAFVWADSTGSDFASTANNQFLIRAGGGVGIGVTNPAAALDVAGTVRASAFQGDGSGLTALSASSLAVGTITNTITFNPASGPPFIAANQNVATGLNADFLDGWHGDHYWQLGGNSAVGPNDFLGTKDNTPLEFAVNSQRALRLEPNDYGAPNVIWGSAANYVAPGVVGATIAGGGDTNYWSGSGSNSVAASFGTIGGGLANTIVWGAPCGTIGGGESNKVTGYRGTIGGGEANTIELWTESSTIGGGGNNYIYGYADDATIGGGCSNIVAAYADYAAIGGGLQNHVGANAHAAGISGGCGNQVAAEYATIGGGNNNHIQATGTNATIGGGYYNVAAGNSATVPGGANNSASGFCSFAGGCNAHANYNGSFVWGGTGWGRWDDGPNQVIFECWGVYFADDNWRGVYWTPESGSWNFWSDRKMKEGFAPVDGQAVLEKVASLPLSEWSYRGYSQRHIGPMAQDFHAAFPLNDSDTALNDADLHGVALAAIQGLNEKVESGKQKAESRMERLEAENAELKKRLEGLEQLVLNLTAKKE